MPEDHRANCEDGRTDPDQYGGSLLGNGWRRFHDSNNRNAIKRFRAQLVDTFGHNERRGPFRVLPYFFAFATCSIEIPNRAVLLMIVVTGRSNFLAMVCSGVCAFNSAINSRWSIIDHAPRLNSLAMMY
jgi:hypothetical protein